MARGHGGGSSGYFVHAGCALTFAVILVNCYLVAMENYLGKLFNDMKVNVVSLWSKRSYAIQLQRMAARTHSLVTDYVYGVETGDLSEVLKLPMFTFLLY